MFKLGKADTRLHSAREHVYSRVNEVVYKATRVGLTTNIIAFATQSEKRVLLVCPTIKIGTNTAQEGIILSKVDGAVYRFISSNKKSICFQERAANTPALKDDARVFTINSDKCAYLEKGDTETHYCEDYESCPVVTLLRTDISDIDLITITHDKFASYNMAYKNWLETRDYRKNQLPPIPVQIYQKLIKWADIILYDECHYLELPDITPLSIYSNNEPDNYNNLRQYAFKNKDGQPLFPLIADMVEHFIEMIEHPEILQVRDRVIDRASTDDYWTKHLCDSIENPSKYIFKDDNGEPYEHQDSGLMEFYDTMLSLIEYIGDEHTIETSFYLSIIYDIAKIVTSDIIALSASRKGESISVEILVNDSSKSKNTSEILKHFRQKGVKIIMTSATIGDHDYSQYLGKNHLNSFWGTNGDPLHSNANMLVLCDSKTFDTRNARYGLKNNLPVIASQIIRYKQTYGDVKVFAMSARWATRIQNMLRDLGHPHEVDYYGSTSSIGVSCDARVAICVCMAETPTNMCDPMFTDNVTSKNMRLGLVHAATMQALSRVKDPNGKVPSLAIMLGVRERKAIPMLTWGSNRKVTIDMDGEVHVTCDEYIPMPHVKECKDYDTMFEEALKFKKPKNQRKCNVAISLNENSAYKEPPKSENSISGAAFGKSRERNKSLTILSEKYQEHSDLYMLDKYMTSVENIIFPIVYTYGSLDSITTTKYLLLNKIISRHDIFEQMDENGYYVRQNQDAAPEIEEGQINILKKRYCMLTPDNKVGCMFFDINGSFLGNEKATSMYNKEVICNYLDSQNISHLIEERDKFSFRIWIFFTEKINARDVKEFGKHILKELSIKDVDVYPKQCINKKDSKGDFVELPQTFDNPTVSMSPSTDIPSCQAIGTP